MIARTREIGLICLAALLLAACRVVSTSAPPQRCMEEVNLAELIEQEGVPQVQPRGWGTSSVAGMSENRIFDGEQEAVLTLDHPGPFVSRLCEGLKARIAEGCNVEKFWSGAEHCLAVLSSQPSSAGAGRGRPVTGRAALFASRTPEGSTAVILTYTEWAQ